MRPRAIMIAAMRSCIVQRRQSLRKSCIAKHPPVRTALGRHGYNSSMPAIIPGRGLTASLPLGDAKIDRCASYGAGGEAQRPQPRLKRAGQRGAEILDEFLDLARAAARGKRDL